MEKSGNWSAGEKVPRTGTYKCIFCGPDGIGASALKHAMKSLGLPYTPPAFAQKKPPYRFFKEEDTFPSCPNCKKDPSGSDPTGWDFVSEEEVTGDSTSKCFIATACYGSADAAQVVSLREYRDRCLMRHAVGRAVGRLYSRISPPLADRIRRRPRLQAALRRLLIGPLAQWARARLRKHELPNQPNAGDGQ